MLIVYLILSQWSFDLGATLGVADGAGYELPFFGIEAQATVGHLETSARITHHEKIVWGSLNIYEAEARYTVKRAIFGLSCQFADYADTDATRRTWQPVIGWRHRRFDFLVTLPDSSHYRTHGVEISQRWRDFTFRFCANRSKYDSSCHGVRLGVTWWIH